MHKTFRFSVVLVACAILARLAIASGPNFNDTDNKSVTSTSTGNVGIGTTTPQGGFVVTNGNVGIGTWAPAGALVVMGGNVGIGTTSPGAPLSFGSFADGINIGLHTGVKYGIGYGTDSNSLVHAYLAANGDASTAVVSLGFQATDGTMANYSPKLVIRNTGNVGIGSTAPTEVLNVIGNVRVDNSAGSAASGGCLRYNGSALQWSDDCTIYSSFSAISAGSSSGWTNDGTIVHLTTNSTNVGIGTSDASQGKLIVTGGNVGIGTTTPQGGLVVMNGNVGIGTLVPQYALEVNGTVSISANKPFEGNSGNAGGFDVLSYHSSLVQNVLTLYSKGKVTGDTSGNWQFNDGTNNTVYFQSGGNVGIGTTIPASKLVVAGGGVGIGTNANSSFIQTTAPNGGMIVEGNVGIGTTVISSPGGFTNFLQLGGAYPGLVLAGSNTGGRKYTIGSNSNGVNGWLDFYDETATASRMAIDKNGNVGIGTTLPESLLYVKKSTTSGTLGTSPTITVRNTSTATGSFSYMENSANNGTVQSLWVADGLGTGPILGAAGAYIGMGGNYPFSVVTNNIDRIRILGGGNVGIGSTAPTEVLNVIGNVRVDNSAGSAASGGCLRYDGATLQWSDDCTSYTSFSSIGIGTSSPGGWTDDGTIVHLTVNSDNVGIGTVDASQGKLIVTGGNVGIGTTIPSGIFQVSSGTVNTYITSTNSGNYARQFIYNDSTIGLANIAYGSASNLTIFGISTNNLAAVTTTGSVSGMVIGISANSPLILATNSVERVRITSGGNVGIGTDMTSASAKLAIIGGNVGIGTTSPGSNLSVLGGISAGSYATTAAPSGGMIISGNVGIGSAIPTEVLNVIGNVRVDNSAGSAASGGCLRYDGATLQWSDDCTSYTSFSSIGIGTSSPGGWTDDGTIVHLTANSDNVGIGTVDASSGKLIVTGGNVGIGVTNPATLLEVSSASTNPGLAIARFTNTNGAGGGGSVIQLDRSASARVTAIEFSTANTPDWYIGQVREGGNPTTNFVFNAGNDLTLSSASKLVINNAGNVGIGTTTPQTKLAIWDGNVGIGTITADNGRLIVMGGNVGIGTTSPGAKLHVAGTSYFGDVGTAGTFRLYDATAGGTGSYVIFTNTAGKLTITPGSGSASTVNTVETTAKLVPSTDNVFVLGTTALRWLNLQVGTGDSSFAGNVGIGTTTPQGAFVVTNGNVGIGTWTAANGALSVIGGNVGIGTNTTHAMLEMTGNGAKELFRANDSGPNDISPFVIASSGNVGIGTTAPGTALDVWGTIPLRLTRSGVGDWNFLITTNAGFGGTGALRISPVNITTNTGGVEIVNTSSTAVHAFRLDGTVYHSGNVGIGTTTPQAGLVSMGNVGIGTWTSPNSLSIVGGAAIGSATSAATASPSNGLIVSGNVGIGTTSAANDNLIVNGGGNVGIGTAATSALLTVNGTIRSLSAGNVGIGSTAPGAKLDVQGGIRSSQGVAGQAACWRSDGTLGQCTSAVGVAGACTCS